MGHMGGEGGLLTSLSKGGGHDFQSGKVGGVHDGVKKTEPPGEGTFKTSF